MGHTPHGPRIRNGENEADWIRGIDLQASETKEEGVSAEKVEDWWNRVRREKD